MMKKLVPSSKHVGYENSTLVQIGKLKATATDPFCEPFIGFEKSFIPDPAAVDKNFNYEKFPELSNAEKAANLPKLFIDEVEMEKTETFLSHPKHTLRQHSPKHHPHWACDKVKGVKTCQSKGIPKYQSKGGWRCDPCDFDLCTLCARTDKCIQIWSNRED